jgi:hypothetical protein
MKAYKVGSKGSVIVDMVPKCIVKEVYHVDEDQQGHGKLSLKGHVWLYLGILLARPNKGQCKKNSSPNSTGPLLGLTFKPRSGPSLQKTVGP